MTNNGEFDGSENFQRRFDWTLEEGTKSRKDSCSKVGSLRRLTIRRHRYSRCCKVIAVLGLSMILTQIFFFYTGNSVSAFSYKRTMPMALFFESLGYDYGGGEHFPEHGLGEDYDLLMDDANSDLLDELEVDQAEVEGDYEYNNALHEVRKEMQKGVIEDALSDPGQSNEVDNGLVFSEERPSNVGAGENVMIIPKNAPLPPMVKGPTNALPPLLNEQTLLSRIFPSDHKAGPETVHDEIHELPPEQLRLLQPVQQPLQPPQQSQFGQVQQPQLQQLFPGMQNLQHDQHDGIISLDQLQNAHAEHEQHIESLSQPSQDNPSDNLGISNILDAQIKEGSNAPANQMNDEQLLHLLSQPPANSQSSVEDHMTSVIEQYQQSHAQLSPSAVDPQPSAASGSQGVGQSDTQTQHVLTPKVMAELLQQQGNPTEQTRILREAMQQQRIEQQQLQLMQQQQQQPPSQTSLLQQQQDMQQNQPLMQQQLAMQRQQSPLIADHRDPIQQLESQLVSDLKEVPQDEYTPGDLIDDHRDPNALISDGIGQSLDLHEEHISDAEMIGVNVPPTSDYSDRTDLGLRPTPDFVYGYFPDGFMWTAATAAFQIEGGWNEDGKGKSIWDVWTHEGHVEDNSNAHIACDSYHKYLDDIIILKELGVKSYRFSIAWTRIQPNGFEKEPNHRGIEYYNRLINALLNANIQPMVTLYHWDMPQWLQERGGWLNQTIIINAFTNYAKMCFEHFGDRVKFWITLNEPSMIAWIGYGRGKKAPGVHGESDLVYIAGHNLIRAHSSAYKMYQKEFQAKQRGFIGISLNIVWKEPKTNSPKDIEATERAMQFDLGWFANPIYGDGNYPEVMRKQIARKSMENGLMRSRLPEFTEAEIEMNKGTSDFFGLNTYTSRLVEHFDQPNRKPTYFKDQDVKYTMDPNWRMGERGRAIYPEGLRKLLSWIQNKYGPRPIYITENGISDDNGTMNDYHRVDYLRNYINAVLKSITIDGVRVIGYTVWSLMDNFEWERGYQEKLGLYYVDFADPLRRRTAKASAKFYAQLIADNGFPPPS